MAGGALALLAVVSAVSAERRCVQFASMAVAPMPNTMAVDAPEAEWRVANVTVDATFAKEAAQRAGFVLRAPDGGAAVLVAPGTLPACVASLDGLTFDDRGELATLSLEEEHPAVALAGTWRPASQLGALEGGAGAWALDAQLVDDEGGAPSTVDAWSLTLCTDGEVAVPLEKAKGGRIFARDDDKLREDSDADLVRRLSSAKAKVVVEEVPPAAVEEEEVPPAPVEEVLVWPSHEGEVTQGGGWAAILEAAATDAKAAVAAHPAMSIGSTLKTLATVKAARTAAKVGLMAMEERAEALGV